jgi:hypothetical protein
MALDYCHIYRAPFYGGTSCICPAVVLRLSRPAKLEKCCTDEDANMQALAAACTYL